MDQEPTGPLQLLRSVLAAAYFSFGRQVSLLFLSRPTSPISFCLDRLPSMTLGGGRGLLAATHCDNGAVMPPADLLALCEPRKFIFYKSYPYTFLNETLKVEWLCFN